MYNKYFKTTEAVDNHAMSKATMLQKLYFPELKEVHAECLKAHALFHRWLAKGLKELAEEQRNGETIPIISEKHMKEYSNLLAELNKGTLLVEAKAEAISEKLNVS